MDLSPLIDAAVVMLLAVAAVAACLLIARLSRLDRFADVLDRRLRAARDDAFSKLSRLLFPIAGVLLVVTVVGLGLIAEPIWAATTLVLLCAGMTAAAISGSRSPTRVEARAESSPPVSRPVLKKAA